MNYSRVRQQLEEYYKQNIKNEHKSRKIGFSYYANDDEDLEEGSGTDTGSAERFWSKLLNFSFRPFARLALTRSTAHCV